MRSASKQRDLLVRRDQQFVKKRARSFLLLLCWQSQGSFNESFTFISVYVIKNGAGV
jgi:hypothetical protein